MKTYTHTIDGRKVATYRQPTGKRYRSLKQIKQTAQRRERDAQLLKALTR